MLYICIYLQQLLKKAICRAIVGKVTVETGYGSIVRDGRKVWNRPTYLRRRNLREAE